jgi:cardiolipin synthase
MVAAVTDWFDGYLARKLNQTSAFGAFLDPVADKLMVAAALIVLVQLGRADAIPDRAGHHRPRDHHFGAARMDGQIGAARAWRWRFVGKLKTAAQMSAIPMLLWHAPVGSTGHRLAGHAVLMDRGGC